RQARGRLLVGALHGRRRQGREPQASGRPAAARAGLEGHAFGQEDEGAAWATALLTGNRAAHARRPWLPRLAAREDDGLGAPGRERSRARVVSAWCCPFRDAEPLAGGGARGPGGCRAHLRARASGEGGRLRSLLRYAQPGLRWDRSRGAELERGRERDGQPDRALRRRTGQYVLLVELRRQDRQRAGRLVIAARALPGLGP